MIDNEVQVIQQVMEVEEREQQQHTMEHISDCIAEEVVVMHHQASNVVIVVTCSQYPQVIKEIKHCNIQSDSLQPMK